jgi:3-methyl-2-oxobutanoate hydroxymethyltransferase
MMKEKVVSVNDFLRMKKEGIPITSLTSFDSIFSSLLDEAGVDLILVGDSLANVFQGKKTTVPVTLEEMIYHAEIVARNVKRGFVAVDMPFMSFQVSAEEALRNAGRLLKETGCKGVKLEGGVRTAGKIRAIVESGIPVIAHIGLVPQSINVFGGYGVQGVDNASLIMEDALAIEQAGAFAVVVEKIPKNLAKEITSKLSIPTIGIGAGPYCDGQILVTADMLGLFRDFKPKFARKYADLSGIALEAFSNYVKDVRNGTFPNEDESY